MTRAWGWAAMMLATTALSVAGCKSKKEAPPAPPPPKVTVAKPVLQNVTDYGEYTGFIESVQIVGIRARITGYLKKIHFKEGTDVEKDALLYEIDPREFEAARDRAIAARDRATADLDKANAEYEKASFDKKQADRIKMTNAISDQEYLQYVVAEKAAKATIAQAAASLQQAKAALETSMLDLEYTKIRAPISGRISRSQVKEGNLVGYNEATLLTNVIATNPVHVLFDVPERDAIEYDRRAKAFGLPKPSDGKIPVEVGVLTEAGYPHHGVIDFRENRFETGTGTVRMRGELSNKDRLLSTGMYARVRVPKGEARDRLMVPMTAVMSDQRGRYVYVVDDKNMVEYRAITTGPRAGTLISAETGLKPTDRVIINGTQKARPKAPVEPEEASAIPTTATK